MAGDVSFKFTGDASDLNAELKKVDANLKTVADAAQGVGNDASAGLGKLGKAANSTGKQLKGTTDGLAKLRPAGNGANESMDRLEGRLRLVEDAGGETSSIMSGLAGALGVVSPGAAAVAQTLGDTAGGIEAVARSGTSVAGVLGPVAVAVAAAGAAYLALSAELDKANEKIEENREKLSTVVDMHREVKEAVLLAALAETELAVARGTATQGQAEAIQAQIDEIAIAQKATDIFGARREALEADRAALEERAAVLREAQAKQERLNATVDASVDPLVRAHMMQSAVTNAQAETTSELANVERQLANNDKELATLDATQARYVDSVKRAADANKEKASAVEQASATESKANDVQAQQIETLAALRAQNEQLFLERQTQADQAVINHETEMDRLAELAQANADNDEILAQIELAKHQRQIELAQQLADLQQAHHEEELQRDRELMQSKERLQQQVVAGVSGLVGASADGFRTLAQVIGEEDKKAAHAVFAIYKSLALADIALKTAQGYMTAASLPPPASGLKYAEVSVQAASSTLAVSMAKPTFHTGSGFVRAPSGIRELNATLREGEAVSTPMGAEMIGRDRIEAANAGVGGASRAPVVFQYEHRQFSQFIRDNLRRPGPLARMNDRKRRVGFRGSRG